MGAWKDWELGMIEDGATQQQIRDAEARIKGEMPCEFHAFDGHSTFEERQASWRERAIKLLQEAFPGAELIDEKEAA